MDRYGIEKMIRNKRAQIFQIIYVVLIIIGLFGLIYVYQYLSSDVECSGLNPSCPEHWYCGVDFKCHDFPDLSKTTTQQEITKTHKLFPGTLFIIFSVIISCLILWGFT